MKMGMQVKWELDAHANSFTLSAFDDLRINVLIALKQGSKNLILIVIT